MEGHRFSKSPLDFIFWTARLANANSIHGAEKKNIAMLVYNGDSRVIFEEISTQFQISALWPVHVKQRLQWPENAEGKKNRFMLVFFWIKKEIQLLSMHRCLCSLCLEDLWRQCNLWGSHRNFSTYPVSVEDSSCQLISAGGLLPAGQLVKVVLWYLDFSGGKRDQELILPINSSLSVTLHQDQLKTTTTAAISRDFKEDRLWLNGKEGDIGHPRLQSCLQELRRLARKRRGGDDSGDSEPLPLSLTYKVHIASENNFPTAAGLASSAAGYACLVYTLAKLYSVEGELSEVARQGSGSACRSMFGGFVQWIMGEKADGKDSLAHQVAPETHWPNLRVLILVVSAEKKPVGSTAGMQTSMETSPLLKHRAEAVVPERMAQMTRHIQQRDFEAFAELTMKDSNQFHATCLDTFPPIFYLNDVSKRVIALVHRFNAHYGKAKVGYTFDAGPNAVLFALEDTVGELVEVVKRSFPPDNNGGQFLKGLPVEGASLSDELLSAVVRDPAPGAIQYLLLTKPGPGPMPVEDASGHLLGADGLPRSSC